MHGPASFEQCSKKGKSFINKELKSSLDREMTEGEKEQFDMDGYFAFEEIGAGAGGVYITYNKEF